MVQPLNQHDQLGWVYIFSMYAWCGVISATFCVILTLVLNFFFLSYESWLDAILYVLWSTFVPALIACTAHVALINQFRLSVPMSVLSAGLAGLTVAIVLLSFLTQTDVFPQTPGSTNLPAPIGISISLSDLYVTSVVIGSFFISAFLGLLNWMLLRVWRHYFEV